VCVYTIKNGSLRMKNDLIVVVKYVDMLLHSTLMTDLIYVIHLLSPATYTIYLRLPL